MENKNGVLLKKIRQNEDEYFKYQFGDTIGLVMSTGRGKVGYSVANIKKGDKFDRELAEKICMDRMSSKTIEKFEETYFAWLGHNNMADRIHRELINMLERSNRYFK